jgi:hypothetical protein
VLASSMMVVAAAVVVGAVEVEDGLALEATLPARAEITIYPVPVTGRHTWDLTTVGARQAVT